MSIDSKQVPAQTSMPGERWQAATDIPLTVAALVFVTAYAYQVLTRPDGDIEALIVLVMQATWGIFVVDYLVRLYLAPARWQWFTHHLLDLAMVVLPMFRPLRLLRLVTLLVILHRRSGVTLRGRVVVYAAGATTLLIAVAALAMLDAERDAPGADITDYGKALWWAMVTVTTVGYGDVSPITDTGRIIAAGLMIGGIALLGIVTATLASWLVDRVAEQDETAQSATRKQVADLAEEVRALARRTEHPDLSRIDTDSLRAELLRRESN